MRTLREQGGVVEARRPALLVLGLAFGGFLLLGLTSAQIGVSWPAVRADFGLPLDALGILLIANTVGNLMGSVLAGRLAAALGIGSHLLLSNLLGAAGLAGYALAPAWWVIVACGLLVGWGGGSLVSGLSIYVADHHSVRSMNWLHASFGLGATLSPLLVTGLLRVGLSWRWGFTAVALAYLALALGITLTRRQWRTPRRAPGMLAANAAIGLFVTLRRPVVWLSIAIFFVYTGLEMVAGQWGFSLFTEARGVALGTAGAWMSLYWGGVALGRVALGAIAERFGVDRLLRMSLLLALVGALFVWLRAPALNALAMPLLGLGLAPIFPSLTSRTAERVGPAHAHNSIGLQTGFAGLGGALVPALAGVLAENITLELIGPFLFGLGVLLLLLYEASLAARQDQAVGSG